MRLTIVNQFYPPDFAPTGKLAASLAEHRAAGGDEVTIVTSRGGYAEGAKMAERSHGDNPRVVRIWTPALGKASALKRILDYAAFYLGAALRLATLRRQDVIISMTTPPFITLATLLHKLFHPRTRLVLWVMDCYPDVMERFDVIKGGGIASRVLRWLNRFLFARIDVLVTLDSAMEELLLSQYANPSRMPHHQVIPNWEPAAAFPPDFEAPPWTEAEALGIAGDRFVVIYAGNAGFGHNFEALLEAARELQGEPVTFLFIGGGKRRLEIEATRKRLGLHNLVLLGYLPSEEARAALGRADCALITLDNASLGVMSPSKLHANLATRLPVLYIGPKGSNVDEAIERFGCGASLRQDDAPGVVAFIRRMLTTPPARKDLKRRARAAFETAYCDRQTLPQFDQVLSKLE